MTDLLDSELQAAWDRNQKAPPHKRLSEAELFEKFKKKEPEKKGWLSHLASSYETQADVVPKYAGFIRNTPAVAAGFASLIPHGLGTIENALRFRGEEGQQQQHQGVRPSESFHLLGRDMGMTPAQFSQEVQGFVPQPGDENFPILGEMGREEGSQVQERIARFGDFITKRIFRPIIKIKVIYFSFIIIKF